VQIELEAEKLKRQAKQIAKEKYQSREKKPIRETISLEEFELAVKMVTEPISYKGCRVILALCLLYLTGLRISQLLELTVKQFQELLDTNQVYISQIKNGDERFLLAFNTKQRNFLTKYITQYEKLLESKEAKHFLFTSDQNYSISVNRSNFNTEVNVILKKLSTFVGKVILSHSFRATVITELLEGKQPIEIVQRFMGHKNIGTTLRYDRRLLTAKQIKKISSNRAFISRKTKLLTDFDETEDLDKKNS
jgi:site-specific recombinase XerD